ncbi:hypothetical protein TNCV_3275391 [Trichonephila clavipes]|nr:hypothetical protein TNCV_3275391 [Trichonephila clavipes]
MMELLPYHDPLMTPWFESFSSFEPVDLDNEFMEQEAAKGKGALSRSFLLWTPVHPQVVFLVYKAWRRYGAQNLTTWTRLAQAVLDGCFGAHMARFVSSKCQIRVRFALSTMHRPRRMRLCHALPPPTLGCEQHVPPAEHRPPSKNLLDTY